MNDLYMNGRGVLRHTRKLNEALFDEIPMAILGGGFMVGGMQMAVCAVIESHSFWMFLGAVGLIGFGLNAYRYFHDAMGAVVKHRKAMQAETARLGKGWARD